MRIYLLSCMMRFALVVTCCVATSAAFAVDLPAHFVYRGTLTAFPDDKQDRGQEIKQFQIDAFVEESAENELVMNYVISENGSGGWHWSQQYGTLTYNRAQQAQSGREWMLLNAYDEAEYEVAFRSPWFEKLDQLSAGATWEENPFVYTVNKDTNSDSEKSWSVNMKHNLSRHQDLQIEKETGLITEARQTVFMGQGLKFQLDWKLEKQLPLDSETWAAVSKVWETLATLQKELKVDLYVPVEELNSDQLSLARAQIDTLKTGAAGTPFESLVRRIELQTELGE
ncbi:MAG: hypothetical protein CMJ46_00785, partial [Planctomyces sp.]|nr:hypothetical protein [Planctomyces sp.]